jgi:uncharacterized protein
MIKPLFNPFMKKIIFAAILAVMFASVALAQSDTTYYDQNWQRTTKESAAYYRPVPKAKDSGYWIQDYFISGALQMEGFSSSNTDDVFEGEMNWYYENGKPMQKANYVNGVQHGEIINYDKVGNELSRGLSKLGEPFKGSFFEEGPSYYVLRFYENGVVQKFSSIANTATSKARVDIFYKEGNLSEAWFYNQSGGLIGKSKINSDESISDGVLVSYYFNPMLVESVLHIKDNKYIDPAVGYYTNGKLKFYQFHNENKEIEKEVYFDQKGARIDSIILRDSKPYKGVLHTYHPRSSAVASFCDNPMRITPYKEGLIDGIDKEFYENGNLKSASTYIRDALSGTRTTYDSTGRAIYTMQYQDGTPYNGTFIDWDNAIKTYKDGTLTDETQFYANGKVKFTRKASEGVTIYDESGKILSKLEYKDGMPYSGKIVELSEGLVSIEETYKDGQKVSEIYYSEGKILEKSVYTNNEKLNTQYYPNGKVKQETKYVNDNEREVTYYDNKGSLLGKLQINDSYELSGTKCVFDYDTIAEITEYVDNKIVRSRKFFNNGLLYDKNYNGNATFYDPFGKKTYTCSFREGNPYTGTEVEYDDYNKTIKRISNYLNGKLHGSQILANYNYDNEKSEIYRKESFFEGGKNGLDQEFHNENLMKEIPYKKGAKDGVAKYFNKEGKLIATGTYKDDNPWSGKFMDYNYDYEVYSEESYIDGNRDGAFNSYEDGTLVQSNLYKANVIQKSVTYTNGEPKYTLLYRNGEPYEGTEKNYNGIYFYKNSELTERQEMNFETGQVKSREIYSGNNSTHTAYYANGKVKLEEHIENGSIQGEATYYAPDGKILGKGEYVENIPVSGKFAFFHTKDDDARIELTVTSSDLTAVVIVGNTPAHRLKFEILSGSDENISSASAKFLRILKDTFDGYDISDSY